MTGPVHSIRLPYYSVFFIMQYPVLKLLSVCCLFSLCAGLTIHAAKDDACTCLNWKQTYATKVYCMLGDGYEFYQELQLVNITDAAYKDVMTEGRCQYLTKYDDNFCLNRLFEPAILRGQSTKTYETDTWCYVSKECTDLNGGKTVPEAGLSAKICKPSENIHAKTLQEFQDMETRWGLPSGFSWRRALCLSTCSVRLMRKA